MQGSSLVACLSQVPCPNCGNQRDVALHAVWSGSLAFLWCNRTYHCFNLDCPVCHHGNSWPEKNKDAESEIPVDESLASEIAGSLLNLPQTLRHYRQLGVVGKVRYRRMLTRLGLEKLAMRLAAEKGKGVLR